MRDSQQTSRDRTTVCQRPQEAVMDLAAPEPSTWYERQGPFVTCWLPAPSAAEDPRERARIEWKHAREQLNGSPPSAIEAIERLLGSERPRPNHQSLLLVADSEGELAGAHLADQPDGASAWVDSLPRLAPALQALQGLIPHLIVVTDRTGADIVAAGESGIDTETVDGETLHIHRSHPGGWSQRRFQQRAENTWERNAKGVADEVDSMRQQVGARLVVVAGDPRAVGFLTDHASEELKSIIHHVEGAGRSDDDPFAELADDVERLIATVVANDIVDVLERYQQARQTDGVADGPDRTLGMLSQSRVSELLVHDDPSDERRAYFDRESHQASQDASVLTELGLEPVEGRLIDVALWAAHATGAGIHFVPNRGPKSPSGSLGGLLRH